MGKNTHSEDDLFLTAEGAALMHSCARKGIIKPKHVADPSTVMFPASLPKKKKNPKPSSTSILDILSKTASDDKPSKDGKDSAFTLRFE